MSGAGGREVGRISIRVVPDLDQFRTEVKAAVAALPDGEVDVNAKVHADTKGVKEEVKAKTAGMEATVKVKPEVDRAAVARWQKQQLGALSSMMGKFEARAPLTEDGEGLRKSLVAQEKFLRDMIMKLNLELEPGDLARARAEIDAFREFIERQRPVNIKVDYDEQAQGRFLKNMRELDRQVQSNREAAARASADLLMMNDPRFSAVDYLGNKNKDLTIKADVNYAEAEMRLAEFKAANANDTLKVRVEPNPDWGAFARTKFAVESFFHKIKVGVEVRSLTAEDILPGKAGGGGGNGNGRGPKLPDAPKFGAAAFNSMAQFAQAGGIVVAVLALLAPALALVSGLMMTLPGVVAAAAVPIGVIALGMDGIKKAAEAAKPAFEELKKSVSSRFETGMADGFKQVAERLIPGLKLPLEGVADALSNTFNGVVDTLTGTGLTNLQSIVDNVGVAINRAIPGLQSFTSGFLVLTDKLSAKMPGLSDAFGRVGTQFSNWITEITTADPSTGVSKLDSAMKNMGDTLSEIGGAAKDVFNWSFDNLSDPAFGQTMKEFAQDLRGLINDSLPLFKSGFQDVATIVKGIGTTIDGIKSSSSWLESLGRVPGEKPPGKPKDPNHRETSGLFGLFGKDGVLGDNAPFRTHWGFKDLFPPNEANLYGNEAGKEYGDGVNNGVKSQVDRGGQIAGAISGVGARSYVVGGGASGAGGAGMVVSGQVDTAIAAAKQKLATFQTEFGGLLDTALAPLKDIPTKIGTALGSAAGAMTGAFEPIVQQVVLGGQQITIAVSAALVNLPQVIRGALTGLAGAMTGAFGPAVSAVGTACQKMISLTQGLAGSMVGSGAQAGSAFAGGIQTGMSLAVSAVGGACQQIRGLVGALAQGMFASGASVSNAFAQGIRANIGLVSQAAGDMAAAAHRPIPNSPAETGPFSGKGWVLYSGMSIGEGFADGINASTDQVVDAATNLVTKLNEAFDQGIDLDAYKGDVTQAMKDITLKSDEIRNNLNLLPKGKEGKEARAPLNAELDRLGVVRDQLKFQKDKMGLDDEADKKAKDQKKMWEDLGNRGVQSGMDIGTNVMQSFATDLGISGNGLLPTLMKAGMQFGSQFVFHTSNAEETQQLYNQQVSQQGIGMVGR